MANSWARSRARARIERACTAPLDHRALRLEILAELQRSIGYDAYAWPLTLSPPSGEHPSPTCRACQSCQR